MKDSLYFIFILLSIPGCDEQNKVESFMESTSEEKVSARIVINRDIKFDNKEEIEQNINDYEDQLFGTFYCDRMDFYIVNDPKNKLFGVTVESIILYFIDGELCKTKYIIDADISDVLLKKYGSFKIIGYDEKNKNILLNKKAVSRNGFGIKINENLDNYKLKWTKKEKDINYRVSFKSDNKFEYVEQINNYHLYFREVERQCR